MACRHGGRDHAIYPNPDMYYCIYLENNKPEISLFG